MANYTAARRVRQYIAALKPAIPDPFTDDDWHRSMLEREARDYAALHFRWRITAVPSDGKPREFFLLGRLSEVERRASLIFGFQTHVLAIEPAGHGGEVYSNRLNLSGELL